MEAKVFDRRATNLACIILESHSKPLPLLSAPYPICHMAHTEAAYAIYGTHAAPVQSLQSKEIPGYGTAHHSLRFSSLPFKNTIL